MKSKDREENIETGPGATGAADLRQTADGHADAVRRPYGKPTVARVGSLEDLTAGTGGPTNDGVGSQVM